MPYFPMFIDLKNRSLVVIGAGEVATRKIEKLLPFGPKIRVIADRISDAVQDLHQQNKIALSQRKIELNEDLGPTLDQAEMVFVAVDDIPLQKRVYEWCQTRRIPCNAVDSPDYCSFIFPALVLRDELVVAVSTGGKAPGLSAKIRALLDDYLPNDLGTLVEQVQAFRKSAENKGLSTFIERAKQVGQFAESLLQEARLKTTKDHPTNPPQDPPPSPQAKKPQSE